MFKTTLMTTWKKKWSFRISEW